METYLCYVCKTPYSERKLVSECAILDKEITNTMRRIKRAWEQIKEDKVDKQQ